MGISAYFKDTHVCIITTVISINKEKEICLPNRETLVVFNVKEQICLPI